MEGVIRMSKWKWNFQNGEDNLQDFDIENGGSCIREWENTEALFMESSLPVLLFEELNVTHFRLQGEVLVPGEAGFVGFIFGAADAQNYESVYICPTDDPEVGEIQYDPFMNGSSTWQIYHGPRYQAPAPFSPGKWTTMTLDVTPDGVAVYVGQTTVPQLVVNHLQLGSAGRIGLWGYLPSYVRHFLVEEIPAAARTFLDHKDQPFQTENYNSHWSVSHPYLRLEGPDASSEYVNAKVEENGTLNLHRLFPFGQGETVKVIGEYLADKPGTGIIGFGFSDHLKLWINEELLYEGESKWAPPESDGRIRADFCQKEVSWQEGRNIISAEITNLETLYGCGFCMKVNNQVI
ncbi:hypothetical protein D3C74_101280 [compost metagenome]